MAIRYIFKYKKLKNYFALVLILLFSVQASAIGVTISKHHLNTLLAMSFPVKQQYMQYNIIASQPKTSLYPKTQTVSISALIDVNDKKNKQKSLQANITFQGQLSFDKKSGTLKIMNPAMKEFAVIKNTYNSNDTSLDSIKQMVGQHLPLTVLLDIKQLGSTFLPFMPSSMTIVEGGLRIDY